MRTKIEKGTPLGVEIAGRFTTHERRRERGRGGSRSNPPAAPVAEDHTPACGLALCLGGQLPISHRWRAPSGLAGRFLHKRLSCEFKREL